MAGERRCTDCEASSVRLAPHPGPRCTTHHRAFRKAQKARIHDARVVRVYGLEPGQYESLYVFQDGRCWICRKATGASKRLAVDHDHSTGRVRGLLCTTCNKVVLGQYDVEALIRAVSYLNDPPFERFLRSH